MRVGSCESPSNPVRAKSGPRSPKESKLDRCATRPAARSGSVATTRHALDPRVGPKDRRTKGFSFCTPQRVEELKNQGGTCNMETRTARKGEEFPEQGPCGTSPPSAVSGAPTANYIVYVAKRKQHVIVHLLSQHILSQQELRKHACSPQATGQGISWRTCCQSPNVTTRDTPNSTHTRSHTTTPGRKMSTVL